MDTVVEVGRCSQCKGRFAVTVTVKDGEQTIHTIGPAEKYSILPQNSQEMTYICEKCREEQSS